MYRGLERCIPSPGPITCHVVRSLPIINRKTCDQTANVKSEDIADHTFLVIMAVFCAFTVLNDFRLRDDNAQKIEQNTRALAASMAHDIQNWLDGRLTLMKSIAELMSADASSPNILSKSQNKVLMEQFNL